MSPEEKARQIIDKQLEDAGWVIQDRKEFNPIASPEKVEALKNGWADAIKRTLSGK